MNYQHLQYFQAVARKENYQTTAQELFISQPTLSRAIANLENELGVPLFEKHGRNIRITDFGREFLQYVDQAMESIDAGVRRIHDMANVMGGTISIAAIYGFMYNQLPEIIRDFNKQYLNVEFQIEATTTKDVINKINDGEFDVGFHCGTSKMQFYPDLDFFPITSSELVVIVSKNHPLAKYDALYLKDIVNEDFVSFSKAAGSYEYVEQLFAYANHPFEPRYIVSDDQSIVNMVSRNLAISCIIHETVRYHDGIHVIRILDDLPSKLKKIPIYITTKRKQNYPLALSTFINLVCQKFQNEDVKEYLRD